MEPNRLGRVLGIGTRIAAKTIRERAAQAGQTAAAPPRSDAAPVKTAQPGATRAGAEAAGRAASDAGRKLARGVGRFGSALARPFAHAGGILVLQVSGVFFAIFTLFFLSHAWQAAKITGWHERHAATYLGVGLVFLWFTVSSFWRAKRKMRVGPG